MVRPPSKGGTGRKRIDTTRCIENPVARGVAFSTLFSMASELSALCGARTAVVVFSEHGKVFAFGSTSVDHVLRPYEAAPPGVVVDPVTLAAMRQEVDDAKARVAARKAQMKAVAAKVEKVMAGKWQADVDALDEAELPEFARALERLKSNIRRRVDALLSAPPACSS